MVKNKHIAFLQKRLPYAGVGLLYAFGMCLLIARAFALPVSALSLALRCTFFTALFFAFSLSRPLRVVGGFVAFACVGLFLAVHFSSLSTLVQSAPQMRAGTWLLAAELYTAPLSTALCFLLSLFGFSLCNEDMPGFSILATWAVALVLALLILAADVPIGAYFPLLLSLLLAFGLHSPWHTSALRVAILSLACLLLSFLFLPGTVNVYEPFANAATRMRTLLEDYLFFTESRTVYSLQLSGYQPYGHEHLGGPISPEDDPVMEVETPYTTLLRGVIKNEYTGFYWLDTTASNRYLFIDPRFTALRNSLLDEIRPDASIAASSPLFDTQTISVRMVKDSTTTLFVPMRTDSLHAGEGMVPYFGPSSEIFITRDLAQDDTYRVTAPIFTADSSGMAQLLALAAQKDDNNLSKMLDEYTAVPELVESAVYQLTHAVIQNAQTPFEQAQAICSFLQTQYPYTYNQNTPPADRDFVSWFLLEEKQGYCISYASAMAIMGRIAGLPTRYIEGYVAAPGADGIARVTEQNAHAWVEVYFSGFGWVAFDPTTGSNSGQGGNDGTGSIAGEDGNQNGSESDGDKQNTPPEDNAPDATPTPTPTPEPTPEATPTGGDDSTPPPEDAPTPTPSPSPPPDENSPQQTPTPTPNPQEQPTPTPQPTPPPEDSDTDDSDDNPFPWWLLLLFFLAFAAFCIWRFRMTDPAHVASQLPRDGQRLLVWYRAILLALSCMGIARNIDESPMAHAHRARRILDGTNTKDTTGLLHAAHLVSRGQYSRLGTDALSVASVRRTYTLLEKRMKPLQKAKMLVLRMLHGLGDIKNI